MRIGDLRGVVEAGLCDTATSITVRRPTLSLSRDPDQHGGRRGSIFARTYPSNLEAHVRGLVRRERTRGRAREGGDEARGRGDTPTSLCRAWWFKVQSWRQPGR